MRIGPRVRKVDNRGSQTEQRLARARGSTRLAPGVPAGPRTELRLVPLGPEEAAEQRADHRRAFDHRPMTSVREHFHRWLRQPRGQLVDIG